MFTIRQLVIGFVLMLTPLLATAQSWQAQSGAKQLAVLELFTAEGCGLCPPADRFVEQLPQHGVTDKNLIVLGFHIDYLNQKKGWIDRFAKPAFSERQRQLARINMFDTIFTPEFVISGEVVHEWRKHAIDVIHFVNRFKPEAHIKLNVVQDQQMLHIASDVSVSGKENRNYAKLYLAVTEDDVISHVTGGDNAGATFNHQHLVRAWLGPFNLNNDGVTHLSTELALDKHWQHDKLKVVALVQNLNDGFVLQGLALPLVEQK